MTPVKYGPTPLAQEKPKKFATPQYPDNTRKKMLDEMTSPTESSRTILIRLKLRYATKHLVKP
jgi:hypothetical protein